jgi:hypothetical protein
VKDAPNRIRKTVFNTEAQTTKPKQELKKGRMRSQVDHAVEVKLTVRVKGVSSMISLFFFRQKR